MKKYFVLGLWVGFNVFAATQEMPLESRLDQLAVPENLAPLGVSNEKIYAVQNRFSPMQSRHELSLGGATQFNSDSFLSSRQAELDYRFYLTNRWFLGLGGALGFNSFTASADRLIEDQGLIPDIDYAKFKADLSIGFNLFYGKFRVTMDQVFYFDQYVTLGAGIAELSSGRTGMVTADVGMVFWFGQHLSFRAGVKDYIYQEKKVLSSGVVHSLNGHIGIGVVL